MVDKTSAVNSGDQEKTETVPENAEIRSLGPTDEELRSIANMTDAVALFGQNTTPVAISDVLGTGFSVLDKKDTLCDVPFLIISAGRHFSEENDGYFTTLHVVTETGEKFIVNDGGTGIHAQMEQLEKAMPDGGYLPMYVPRGLRVSKYEVEDDKGKKSQAKTYYLNTGK